MLGQLLVTRHAGPAPDFAIGEQGQPAQVTALARVMQIAQQILEPELQLQR